MIRETIDQPWREVTWDVAIARVASEFKRLQAKHGGWRSAASPRRAAPTKRPIWCRSWCVRLWQQQRRYLRPRLSFRRPAMASDAFGTSAGTQDFDSVEQTDVILVIGANPTDAHPCSPRA